MIAFPGGEARAGDTWVGHGPPGGAVSAMAAAPDGGLVVAGLGAHGLWKSADGGATWAEVGGFTAAGKWVDTVALSPSGAIHVGVSQVGFQGGELLVSDDGGGTFTSVLTAIDRVTRVTFDPTVPGRFYVSTANTGLYRTDDGGATFATVDALFPLDPVLRAVAVDPGDPDHLYIGTQVGVVVTEDGGATLSIVGGGPNEPADIVIDPLDPGVVVAAGFDGIFRSTDGGASWQEYGGAPPSPRVQALVNDPAHGRLWAATLGGGVQGSMDFGQSWGPGGAGVEPDVLSLALGPDGGLLAGGGYGGVYTRDAAGVFKQTSAGMSASTAERVVVSGGRWLAVTRGAGLFASTDGGATWELGAAVEPALGAVTDAASSAGAPEVVYAGTRSGGVLRSSDGGVGWSMMGSAGAAPIAHLAVSPADPDTVYAAQEEGAGWAVRESVDGGASWHPYGSVIDEAPVTDVLFGGEPPRLFVATDGDGLFVSNDGGATFEPPGVIPTDYGRFVLSLAYDPLTSTLYAGLHGNGVARSEDGGATWEIAASTGLTDWWVFALAPHPASPGTLYAGTYDGGVARSDDRGDTFTLLSDGLGPGVVSSLRFATGTTLVACTRGSGVFSIDQPAEGGSGGTGGTGGAGGGTGGVGTGGVGGGGTGGVGGAGGTGGAGGGAGEGPAEGCSCRAAGAAGDGWPAGSVWVAVGLGWLVARRRLRPGERRRTRGALPEGRALNG